RSDCAHLADNGNVVSHHFPLWNSFHNRNRFVRFTSIQRRASLGTLLGALPAISSPSESRTFAAKSAPLICTCGRCSSRKNIRSLKPPNRLISGIRVPIELPRYRAFFALVQ